MRDQPADRDADGEVRALDSKFTVDDNALFRHADIAEMRDVAAADPLEVLAREKGVTYVKLDGEVGVLGNGAGLTMSTVDVVTFVGGRPGELLRSRRRRRRAGSRRRARGDHARRPGARDLLQHLRRDHALRRGRARDPPGGRADGARAADRRAPRRDERGGGAAHPRARPALPNLQAEATMLDGARRAVELGGLMAILVDTETRLVVQGLTGSEGRFHGLRNRSHGTNVVAGVTPGKGGQDVDGHPGVRHGRRGGRRDRREHSDGLRAGAVRRGRDVRGDRRRDRHRRSASRRASRRTRCFGSTRSSRGATCVCRAELPGRALAREGERGDHPRRDLPRGIDRARVALGHAHVPDRSRADPARPR